MLTVFQAFSQFERDLISQRTQEGLESARARGESVDVLVLRIASFKGH